MNFITILKFYRTLKFRDNGRFRSSILFFYNNRMQWCALAQYHGTLIREKNEDVVRGTATRGRRKETSRRHLYRVRWIGRGSHLPMSVSVSVSIEEDMNTLDWQILSDCRTLLETTRPLYVRWQEHTDPGNGRNRKGFKAFYNGWRRVRCKESCLEERMDSRA